MKSLYVFLISSLLIILPISKAWSTTFMTYTDQRAWEAAAGATKLEDFNDEPNGHFVSRDLGDFTATLLNRHMTDTLSNHSLPAIGSDSLLFQPWAYDSSIQLVFEYPISAFGLTYENSDPSDFIEMNIMDESWVYGSLGFFGVIANDVFFDTISLRDSTEDGGDGRIASTYLDDFSYSSRGTAVPEPSTSLLLGSGLVGLGLYARRRKKA